MKKVTILALHLGYGGIENCISTLANSLCHDYNVEIISTYKLYDKPVFPIDNKVKIKYLMENIKPNKKELHDAFKKFNPINIYRESIKALKILKLRKHLMIDYIKTCDSDIIISTRDIHNLWLSKYGNKKSKKIGWEHSHHHNNKKYIDKIIKSVHGLDYFVLISKELYNFYNNKINHCKCVCIPNCINYIPQARSSLDSDTIISIGRLEQEKGYCDLIDVFNIVHSVYPNWKLNIIGDGSQKEKIEDKIKKYKLEDSICLHGFQNKDYINKQLERSSIYVMCSLTECFPIVLLEASSYALPCVAFSSASGASELIKDNWDGYLIENRDKEKMAKRIISLIKDKNRRIIMGDNAYKKSLNYKQENITKKWIDLFEEK